MQNYAKRREFSKERFIIKITTNRRLKMAKNIPDLIEKAREELSKVTGLELSTTLGAVKEEKGWKITMEMIEKHSIPDQMDIMAVYETILDDDGNMIEFNRKRLRKRVDTEEIEEE